MVRTKCSLVLAVGLLSCGDDAAPPGDAGADGPSCADPIAAFETGDPDGYATPASAPAGEARAGRVTEGMLPVDPDGLATWAAGDFVLANAHIAMLVEDARDSDLYGPYGGQVGGVMLVEDGQLTKPAAFYEVMLGLGRFVVNATSVTVLNDGSDGETAAVRVVGTAAPIPFIDELAAAFAPEDYADLEVAMDYELAPGTSYVDIYLSARVTDAYPVDVDMPVHLFMQRSRMPAFVPGYGFVAPPGGAEVPYLAFVDDDGASYAWAAGDGSLREFMEVQGVSVLLAPAYSFEACAVTREHAARVYVAGPGLDSVLVARGEAEGDTRVEVSGAVTDALGAPASGVRVHAQDATGEYLTRATTDASGAFALHLPAGEVSLTLWRRGDDVVGPMTVTAPATGVALQLEPSSTIRVTTTDGDGTPLPSRIQVIANGDVPGVDAAFGEPVTVQGRLHVDYSVDGTGEFTVPVGSHRVIVSRGFEYEIFTQDVDAAAGETVEVAASLDRVVDTTDYQCADFHVHTHRSPDAEDDLSSKVRAAVADGVEIPVRSEHEFVADFMPAIEELGVEQWAFGISSLELSTFTYGHFGVFPLVPNPAAVNAGAIQWVGRLPPEVFAEVRNRPEAPALMINHPRQFGSGLLSGAMGAYFVAAEYDPTTGIVGRPDYWDEDFTLVEVFNGSSYAENADASVLDWLSLLSSGRHVFAVGSSDSHEVARDPMGYPRTYLLLGTDDPTALTANQVRDAANLGAMVVSGGIFVTAAEETTGAGPGESATGVGDTATIRVRVQAPTWVDVDSLAVVVDGATVETLPVDELTADPLNPVVRFDELVDIAVASGGPTYVIFAAEGTDLLEPVFPGRSPFGVTNPIFLER